MLKKIFCITVATLMLSACGGQEPVGDDALKKIEKGLDQKTNSGGVEAASLLTAQIIADALGIDASVVAQSSNSQRFVGYHWEKADKEAINAKIEEIMKEYFTKRVTNPSLSMPRMPSTENDVSLATNTFDNAKVAATSFKGHVAKMKEGVKVESQGETYSFKIIYDQPVEGVGAQAAWSTVHRQLAVQHKNMMMFLTVKVSDDKDLELAKKIMNAMLAKY